MSIAYLDGKFIALQEAALPLTDRGFLFGDGVFTTIFVENGEPIWLKDHLQRVGEEAKRLHIEVAPILPALIYELLKKNQLTGRERLKVIITGGDTPGLHLAPRRGRVVLLLTPLLEEKQKTLQVGIFPLPNFLRAKTLSYLDRLVLREQAKSQGWDECITTLEDGTLLETTTGNLFWRKNGELYTPDPKLPLYFGVALTKMIEKEKRVHYVHSNVDELENVELYRINACGCSRLSLWLPRTSSL
ncbi:MAG: aminotransferase class IV [Chlamydiales bacterium]